MTNFVFRLLILIISIAPQLGCTPTAKFVATAKDVGLVREDIMVHGLPLVIFHRNISTNSSRIHFYFDGDGMPWVDGVRVADDPTSRNRLILKLIDADPHPAVLIGRPCYYVSDRDAKTTCDPSLWTSHRFSTQVVSAMAQALEQVRTRFRPVQTVLIGYSGGGTLAMLAANKIKDVDQVVTIAANLDVDGWTAMHGYTPLAQSYNAENFPRLEPRIEQTHFVGAEDKNVPPNITRKVADKQANSQVIEVVGYEHQCCWPKAWASRLEEVLAKSKL